METYAYWGYDNIQGPPANQTKIGQISTSQPLDTKNIPETIEINEAGMDWVMACASYLQANGGTRYWPEDDSVRSRPFYTWVWGAIYWGTPWEQAKKAFGGLVEAYGQDHSPPLTNSAVSVVAHWRQIRSFTNHGDASETLSHSLTTGSSSTEKQVESFEVSVGATVSAGWGPFSASLTTEFSSGSTSEHSISFSSSETQELSFDIPANSTTQIWQLFMSVEDETAGAIEEATPIYVTQSFAA